MKKERIKQLIINGKIIYTFDYNIIEYINLNTKVIVLLDVFIKNSTINENVYCVDMEGKLIWQMEQITRAKSDSPITGMNMLNNFLLQVFDLSGEYFILDTGNGKIVDSSRGKGIRPW